MNWHYQHPTACPGPILPSGRQSRYAFTLVELLVVIAIIAVLVALLIPTIGGARERGRQAKCLSNMRQWATALNLYLAENEGVLPEEGADEPNALAPNDYDDPNAWFNRIPPFLEEDTLSTLVDAGNAPGPGNGAPIFTCPTLKDTDVPNHSDTVPAFSYAYNLWIDHTPSERASDQGFPSGLGRLLRISQLSEPTQFVVFGEVATTEFDYMTGFDMVFRHGGGSQINLAFADGHAQSFTTAIEVDSSEGKAVNRGVIWCPEKDLEPPP